VGEDMWGVEDQAKRFIGSVAYTRQVLYEILLGSPLTQILDNFKGLHSLLKVFSEMKSSAIILGPEEQSLKEFI
jgi:hypothetical protein